MLLLDVADSAQVRQQRRWMDKLALDLCVLFKSPGSYLAVRLAAHNFDSVPLLLRCALLQLAGPKETNPAHVGAITAFRWGHEGRHNQENLKQRDRETDVHKLEINMLMALIKQK